VLAKPAPVRSLRDGTRACALRAARTCYDHLAGHLGVALLAALIERGHVAGHDGSIRPGVDRRAARGTDRVYEVTAGGAEWLDELGVAIPDNGRRPVLAHCVDWTEQRHHLSGQVGSALAARFFDLGYVERGAIRRSVVVTKQGRTFLSNDLGISEFT